ncbi:cation transporter [Paraburkholderia largidicola]|uniref:Cobalt transporter n=1 Tax=Paraburkholderia largidicola TaxID=3014751 RepID=A0A7I8C3F8_9BURK|nr:cation transporter [Paraburkholderia sp. PGU16]BCF95155.1 cobalt transporter [Paraburkholderia sp. PGU16]
MPGQCCHQCDNGHDQQREGYRRLLWVALVINCIMFGVEVLSGLGGRSVSLLADSLDFLGDAANYGISLAVLELSLGARAHASRLKAVSMLVFGVWVLGLAAWHLFTDPVPSVPTMGIVGTCALLANAAVAGLLFRYREGDSNMRSVWLCTRNDVFGNVAVLLATLGVFGTGSAWPDLAVAAIMSALALTSALHILRQSSTELRIHAREQRNAARL